MHLVWFHRVLIGVAILFLAGYGVRELVAYRAGEAGALWTGLVALALALVFTIYLVRLRRILRLPH